MKRFSNHQSDCFFEMAQTSHLISQNGAAFYNVFHSSCVSIIFWEIQKLLATLQYVIHMSQHVMHQKIVSAP